MKMEVERPQVVVLCGSMRFEPTMRVLAAELSLAGAIVLMPHVLAQDADRDQKEGLDALYFAKIDLADSVLVVDCAGPGEEPYVGESTRREVKYARLRQKRVTSCSKTAY